MVSTRSSSPATSYRKDFMKAGPRDPHPERKTKILAKYPKIATLFGVCPRTKYICAALIVFQFIMAYSMSYYDLPWPVLIFLGWAISGTINHMLSLATHEISHNLAFVSIFYNDVLGVACNLAMGIPSFFTFRKYHNDHHTYQGVYQPQLDSDIPSRLEARFIGNSKVMKFLFLLLQPAFYALRPGLVNPKKPGVGELIDWVCTIGCDILILYFWGSKSLFYIVGGTLMGISLHPVAGHFISEHYIWDNEETHSYYGPLNIFAWNVGYHVEHHDFPRIPGSRLPALRKMAPEFYKANPKYQSWVMVMVNFVMDDKMGSFNRVVRTMDQYKKNKN